MEDMTPTLHPTLHRVDTFLVNEPLLPWSLRESVWARGTAQPLVVLSCLLYLAGQAAVPMP